MEVAKHKAHSSEYTAKVAIKGESTLFELARFNRLINLHGY